MMLGNLNKLLEERQKNLLLKGSEQPFKSIFSEEVQREDRFGLLYFLLSFLQAQVIAGWTYLDQKSKPVDPGRVTRSHGSDYSEAKDVHQHFATKNWSLFSELPPSCVTAFLMLLDVLPTANTNFETKQLKALFEEQFGYTKTAASESVTAKASETAPASVSSGQKHLDGDQPVVLLVDNHGS